MVACVFMSKLLKRDLTDMGFMHVSQGSFSTVRSFNSSVVPCAVLWLTSFGYMWDDTAAAVERYAYCIVLFVRWIITARLFIPRLYLLRSKISYFRYRS